jgi:hypothetical protein
MCKSHSVTSTTVRHDFSPFYNDDDDDLAVPRDKRLDHLADYGWGVPNLLTSER